MATYDFIVVGLGSGGGTAVRRLVEQFPFSTVLALESGKDLPTPADRRGDSLQSETDDKLDKTWAFWADQVVTNYGAPVVGGVGSPYGQGGALYAGDFNWIAPPFEQGMGKVVGGSSHHNGMMALRGSPEDYDEWDYALRDGSTDYVLPGNITWAGVSPVVADATAAAAVAAALATGRSVFIADSDDPQVSPPFRVVSVVGLNISIDPGAETIPNVGLVATNVFCSPWNRARMLECYRRIENDIDSDGYGAGVNPFGVTASLHNTTGWTEIGRIGRRRTDWTLAGGDPAKPWLDQRPDGSGGLIVARQSQTQLEMMQSLTYSAAVNGAWAAPDDGVGGTTFPYLPDFNAWSIRIPAGVVPGAAPWGRTFQIPLNYVGFAGSGEPVTGGHNVAKIGRYDKYDERRSTLITAVDPVRNRQVITARYTAASTSIIPGNGELAVGAVTLSGGTATVTAVEARFEVFFGQAGSPTGTGVVGSTATSGPKTGTVVGLEVQNDGTVKYTVQLNTGSAPFVGGDAVTIGAFVPVVTVQESPATQSPFVRQRAQINLTAGVAADGAAITQASFSGVLTEAGIPNLTLVSNATVQKLTFAPVANQVDLRILSAVPFAPAPAANDFFTGSLSGTQAVAVEASSNVTLTDQAWVRANVISGSGFFPGDQAVGTGWQGRVISVDPVLQVQSVVYFQADETGVQQPFEALSSNVVLGAGPFNTPAILQRSGIGPADRLSAAGVEQILNLGAVGDRALQHTIWNPFVFFMNAQHPTDQSTYVLQMADLYRSNQDRSALGLSLAGEVPSGTTVVWEVGANNPTGPLLFDTDFDTIGIIVAAGTSAEAGFASATGGFGLGTKRVNAGPQVQAVAGPGVYTQGRLAILSLANFKPRSRGRGVFINSDSAFDLPTIDHGIVADYRSKDAECLLEHADQAVAKLFDPTVAGGFAASSGTGFAFPFVLPPAPLGGGQLANRISQTISSMGAAYHVVGTCTMGSTTDAPAPLDARARLKHVVGVRVVDTSIMPTHVRANPHLPCVAHAYNIVDMIAEDGGC
jgi:choline dehydrogenase-like flavoprotein